MAQIKDDQLCVLAPNKILDVNYISSTEPEADAPLWSDVTAYAIDATVMWKHNVYLAVKAGTNKDPSLIVNNKGDAAYWTLVGPTNKWALVDDEVSTPTVSAGSSATFVFEPGFFTSIAALALNGDRLQISVDIPSTGENLLTVDQVLEQSAPDDYWEYFYDPFIQQQTFLVTDIAPYYAARATVTLSNVSGGTVSMGMLAFGDVKALGSTQYGASVAPKSYSYIGTNDFGETEIVRGKKATDMTINARLKVTDANVVVQILQDLMDVPCVWIGNKLDNYTNLRTFGLGNGKVTHDNYGDSLLTVNIEGMI